MSVSTRGVVEVMPLPSGAFRLNGTPDADDRLTQESLPTLAAARLQAPSSPGRVIDVAWVSDYRTHARLVARYRGGPVFLAGDAAHLVSR